MNPQTPASTIVRNPKRVGHVELMPSFSVSKCLAAMVDSYLNGPRILSTERPSHLIISGHPAKDCSSSASALGGFDLLLCAAHFLGKLPESYILNQLIQSRGRDGVA